MSRFQSLTLRALAMIIRILLREPRDNGGDALLLVQSLENEAAGRK